MGEDYDPLVLAEILGLKARIELLEDQIAAANDGRAPRTHAKTRALRDELDRLQKQLDRVERPASGRALSNDPSSHSKNAH